MKEQANQETDRRRTEQAVLIVLILPHFLFFIAVHLLLTFG